MRGEVFAPFQGLLGDEAAKAVEALLASVSRPAQGVASALIGVVLLLIGATRVFGELQDALDRIWRAPACDRSGGLCGLVRARLLSFGRILGIAFLLMVSLVPAPRCLRWDASGLALSENWHGWRKSSTWPSALR